MLKAFFNLLKTYFILFRYINWSTLAKIRPIIILICIIFCIKVLSVLFF